MSRKPTWIEIKFEYWYPTDPICWYCRIRTAVDLGHGVINKGKVKNRTFHKFLNVIENAVPTCKECHVDADSYENRSKAYQLKCYELGTERMELWLFNLPFNYKEIFDGE